MSNKPDLSHLTPNPDGSLSIPLTRDDLGCTNVFFFENGCRFVNALGMVWNENGQPISGDIGQLILTPPETPIDWTKIVYTEEKRQKGQAPILCEFSRDQNHWYGPAPLLSLNDFRPDGPFVTIRECFLYCRLAIGIPIAHDGGECPLPKGVRAEIRTYARGEWTTEGLSRYGRISWEEAVAYRIPSDQPLEKGYVWTVGE